MPFTTWRVFETAKITHPNATFLRLNNTKLTAKITHPNITFLRLNITRLAKLIVWSIAAAHTAFVTLSVGRRTQLRRHVGA
jgi:hypothetical protein